MGFANKAAVSEIGWSVETCRKSIFDVFVPNGGIARTIAKNPHQFPGEGLVNTETSVSVLQ